MPDLRGRYPDAERPRQGTEQPATLGEVWDASRTLQAVDNSDADTRRLMKTYAGYLDPVNEYRRREGLPPIQNPALGSRLVARDPNSLIIGPPTTFRRVGPDAAQRDFFAELARIRRTSKDFLPEAGDDPQKLVAASIEREKRERNDARATLDRSSGFVAGVVGFAGGASKALEAPETSLTLPLDAGGRGVISRMAGEALINGLTTMLSQPQAARNRAELGENLTAGEQFSNVAMAAAGGAVITGGLHSGGKMLGAAWDGAMRGVYTVLPEPLKAKWRDAATLPDGALVEIAETVIGRDRFTPEVQAAVNVLNHDAWTEASNPYAAGIAGSDAHADRLANAMRNVSEGRPAVSMRSRLNSGTTLAAGDIGGRAAGASTAEPAMASYMRAVRGAESRGDDAAAAATSSAYGRYQFTRGTWMRYYVKRFGREGLSNEQILAKRSNGATQDLLMADLSTDNAAVLRRAGHDATAANLYTVHFAGPADAVRILDASADTPVRSVMRAKSVEANPWLRDMTVGELRAKLERKVGGRGEPVRVAEDVSSSPLRTDDLDAEVVRLDGELAAASRETVDPSAPEPVAAPEGMTFETAKGSSYRVEADGTTTRDKAFRPEHGEAEQGVMPTSAATYYVSADDAIKLAEFQAQGSAKVAVAQLPDGRIGVRYLEGKDAGKFELRTVVTPERAPAVGLTPVETWRDGTRVHFGNKIVRVSDGSVPAVPARAAAEAEPAFVAVDDFDTVAPLLSGGAIPDVPDRFEPDDAIWDAIDRYEASDAVAVIGRDMTADRQALAGFDDPRGGSAEVQRESLLHDARMKLVANPDVMVRTGVDGAERRLEDVLADLDEDRAVIEKVRACL